ncbi:MAG: hypothetical protein Q8K50_04675 [Hydrogenophaga sp.]|nr:hypothetical protein [Hydrogenophaga sp.]MDP2093173.1 hypothetical protein [Hydrogenophaga sp.]
MVFSSGVVRGNELHAHGLGSLGEVVQDALAVAFLEVVRQSQRLIFISAELGVFKNTQSSEIVNRTGWRSFPARCYVTGGAVAHEATKIATIWCVCVRNRGTLQIFLGVFP